MYVYGGLLPKSRLCIDESAHVSSFSVAVPKLSFSLIGFMVTGCPIGQCQSFITSSVYQKNHYFASKKWRLKNRSLNLYAKIKKNGMLFEEKYLNCRGIMGFVAEKGLSTSLIYRIETDDSKQCGIWLKIHGPLLGVLAVVNFVAYTALSYFIHMKAESALDLENCLQVDKIDYAPYLCRDIINRDHGNTGTVALLGCIAIGILTFSCVVARATYVNLDRRRRPETVRKFIHSLLNETPMQIFQKWNDALNDYMHLQVLPREELPILRKHLSDHQLYFENKICGKVFDEGEDEILSGVNNRDFLAFKNAWKSYQKELAGRYEGYLESLPESV